MKIEVEAVSPVEKKLTIEVDPERVSSELDRSYASLGRRVKLRGFRAGKVPRKVLERNFRDEVEKEVVDRLVTTSFGEAVRSHQLSTVAQPHVDVAEPGLRPAEPFKFTARVEVKPALEPKDYKGLEVARRVVEVTDQNVEEELARIQDRMAQLVPLEGRDEVQEGDYVVADHEATAEGEPFEGSKFEGATLKVGAGDLTTGHLPNAVGKRLGETVEFDQVFPANYRIERLRGKTAHFVATLKALKTRQLPALDDELAKDLGIPDVDTLEKLRARIREDIQKREQASAETELKDALVKAVLAKNEFEVPPALVERAIDGLIQSAAERFARQGMDISQIPFDYPRLRADLREQALFRVKAALILEAIAKAEQFEATDEDFHAEAVRIAGEVGLPLAKVQQEIRSAEARLSLGGKIREDKALAFLTSQAKLT